MAKVRKIDDLRPMFPGYTVLAVNGQSVALLDEKGHPCTYVFRENENTVVTEQINAVNVNSIFGDGDGAVEVPVEQLVGTIQARLDATKTALDTVTAENAELTAKIKAMTEAEHKRREKLVTDTIKNELAENRECFKGDAEIDEHLCDDLLKDECVGKYAEMVDAEGNFVGDERARCDVNNLCNKAVREARKAKNNASVTHYAWELGVEGSDTASLSGIENVLNEYAAKKN